MYGEIDPFTDQWRSEIAWDLWQKQIQVSHTTGLSTIEKRSSLSKEPYTLAIVQHELRYLSYYDKNEEQTQHMLSIGSLL